MKYKELCEQIIELVGGKNNIEAVVHCMTRLRFTLKDRSKAKTDEIKELKDVIDVVSNEVAYQIIIGTQVIQIHEELLQMLGIEAAAAKVKGRKNPFKSILYESDTGTYDGRRYSGWIAFSCIINRIDFHRKLHLYAV